jgi:hypothetical protein
MSLGYITVRRPNLDVGRDSFNTVSVVCFGPRLIEEINEILSIMRNITTLIYTNNEIMVKNCGEGYLPYVMNDQGQVSITSFRKVDSDKDRNMLFAIQEKIVPNLNTEEVELKINTKYTNLEVIKSINNNTVTIIRIETQTESEA